MASITKADYELHAKMRRYAVSRGIDTASLDNLDGLDAVNDLRRAALRILRTAERRCNGVPGRDGFAKWDDADDAKAEREDERNEAKVLTYVARLFPCGGVQCRFDGDPRGAVVKVGTARDLETGSYLGV